jgi:hypothetical protein
MNTAFSVWIPSFQSFFSAYYISAGWFDSCLSPQRNFPSILYR